MATPTWTPSTFYATGSLVQPATAQPAVPTPIPNPSFESGNVEWTLDAGLSIVNGIEHFGPGTWSLQANTGFAGDRFAEMQDFIDCTPGENITARCQIQQGASSFGNTGGAVGLRFYDSLNGLIQDFRGNEVIDGSGGAWHQSSVTASAPANTAFVRIYIYMKRVNQNFPFWADAVEWNKISQAQSGLIFRAVQPTVGLSGSVEPVWPLVNGAQVVDNEVIWEAVLATRVTWEAHAILVSGATEPTFPAQEGGTVGDNTIAWRAVSRRVTDPNCPNSKIVVIAASKVFAADDDIVAYSATVNPLDWSSADDAGYLPTNLQQYGANPVSGIGLYRGNLVPMNTQGSQVWQIDENPAQMALLDAFPVGTAYHTSISPAFNDLFFAASLGVRTTGIAGGSTNLQSGDAGMPIDPLVQEALRDAVVEGNEVNSLYYPAAGQYWLMFSPPAVPTGPISLSGDLSDGMQSTAYSSGPLIVTNGFAPYRWSAEDLPPGLSINEFTGIVSGTPTTSGTFTEPVITVVDRFGRTSTSPQTIEIVFSSDLAVYGPGNPIIRSGLSSAYPVAQTVSPWGGGTPADWSTTEDGTYFLIGYSVAPRASLLKRTAGVYTEVVSPFNVALTQNVGSCAISRDGAYLAVAQGTETWIYKADGDDTYTRIQVITNNGTRLGMKFSPDGNYFATSGNGSGHFFRVFSRSGDVFTQIFAGGVTDGIGLSWSENSGRIAFSPRLSNPELYSVSGSTVTLIASGTSAITGQGHCVLSPDGEHLFIRNNGSAPFFKIYSKVAATLVAQAAPTPTPSAASSAPFDMSSDGRVIAVADGGVSTGTLIYTRAGGVLTHVTTLSGSVGTTNMTRFLESSDYPPP